MQATRPDVPGVVATAAVLEVVLLFDVLTPPDESVSGFFHVGCQKQTKMLRGK